MRRLHDNGVCEGGKPEGRPLLLKTTETMQPGGKDEADVGENRGLRILCGVIGVKSFLSLREPTDWQICSGENG